MRVPPSVLALALVAFWAAAPALGADRAAALLLVEVQATGLNVRERPGADSAVIGHYRQGERLRATLGSTGGWLLVLTRKGEVGYVDGRHVKLVEVLAVEGDAPAWQGAPLRPSGPAAR